MSLLFYHFINTTAYQLDQYGPLSSVTKEFRGLTLPNLPNIGVQIPRSYEEKYFRTCELFRL